MYLKSGRFGPYVQRGAADGEEKPQNASLLKGMQPGRRDPGGGPAAPLAAADAGADPASGEPVVAQNGRFGPVRQVRRRDPLASRPSSRRWK